MKFVIGIDEVGRGSLAGPVTVAAVAATANSKFKITNTKQIPNFKYKNKKPLFTIPLRDSKKLTAKQREEWLKYIKSASWRTKIFYAISSVSPKIIDKINISQAANLAAARALQKLIINNKLPITKISVFLDGGLYLKIQNLRLKTVIKGDEKIPVISLASIVAKVTRDKFMSRLHKKFTLYNFAKNKGYGTKEHYRALKKYGPSLIHRKSFRLS